MSRRVRRTAFSVAALAVAVSCLAVLYQEELENYGERYLDWQNERSIKKHGVELPAVDEVRLLHLEPLGASPSLGTYTVPLYERTEMTIVAEKMLGGSEADDFASVWRDQRLNTDLAACHDPHHVIQFRRGGSTVAEVVVCFTCGNVAIPAFPSWTLVGFDDLSRDKATAYKNLRSTVERHVGAHQRRQ